MKEILSSPTFWSSAVALLVVTVGLKHYIKHIINADKAIEEKRRQKQSEQDTDA